MIRTYLDAGVLIAAARGKEPIAIRALEILDDPNRQFVSSIFLRLELLPIASVNKRELVREAAMKDESHLEPERTACSLGKNKAAL